MSAIDFSQSNAQVMQGTEEAEVHDAFAGETTGLVDTKVSVKTPTKSGVKQQSNTESRP